MQCLPTHFPCHHRYCFLLLFLLLYLASLSSVGTETTPSSTKKGYKLPRHIMANADVARLINSDEVQSVVNPPKQPAITRK